MTHHPAYCLQTGECPMPALKIPKKEKLVVIILWSWRISSLTPLLTSETTTIISMINTNLARL